MQNTKSIEVNRLSKLYRIFEKEDFRDNLTASFAQFLRSPLSNFRRYRSLYRFDDVLKRPKTQDEEGSAKDYIWALKDVSFEVQQGELVGIIGTNGAGKSTLLKILSRITPPTQGRGELRGRVGSLLEVGTGFHPELTGRENVYLNGTILGMTKREIDVKFEEIVEFAGVSKFIDTPVKRYSSGMRVRLAFSVAAHLEPEILIVDEVLAVGDIIFQRKCLEKMEDVGAAGRTVLFVSHNMSAITRLCSRALLLHEGRIVRDGATTDVVGAYLNHGFGTGAIREWEDPLQAPGDEVVRLLAVRVKGEDGETRDSIEVREGLGLEMTFEVLSGERLLVPYFVVYTDSGVKLFTAIEERGFLERRAHAHGRHRVTAWIPGNFLTEGTFFISAAMRSVEPPRKHFAVDKLIAVHIHNPLIETWTAVERLRKKSGLVSPSLRWDVEWLRERPLRVAEPSGVLRATDAR